LVIVIFPRSSWTPSMFTTSLKKMISFNKIISCQSKCFITHSRCFLNVASNLNHVPWYPPKNIWLNYQLLFQIFHSWFQKIHMLHYSIQRHDLLPKNPSFCDHCHFLHILKHHIFLLESWLKVQCTKHIWLPKLG
jgi:hypothetical protein